jgi:hypothetical protein
MVAGTSFDIPEGDSEVDNRDINRALTPTYYKKFFNRSKKSKRSQICW